MARRTSKDWILGINEIRRLMPHWPEELVQDYFHKGAGEANTSSNKGDGAGLALPKEDVDLPFKSLLAGDNVTITEQDETVTIAADTGGNGDSGCFCFEIPEQDCDEVTQSCEAIEDFFTNFGTPGALFLSRNYEIDADPGGGVASTISAVVGPDANVNDFYNVTAILEPFDSCGLDGISHTGAPSGGTVINTGLSRDLGNPNQYTISALIIPTAQAIGSYGIFSCVSDSPQNIQTRAAWNRTTGTITVRDGTFTADGSRMATLTLDGPDADVGVPTAIWLTVSRTSTTFSVSVRHRQGSDSAATTVTDSGVFLSGTDWWTQDLDDGKTWQWGWGQNALAQGVNGFFLWTGLSASLPSESYLERLFFEIRRNQTDFVCSEEPQIIDGSVPVFDSNTDSFTLRPALPPSGDPGQYLRKTSTEPYFSEWDDLPITGGTTGQHLTKASDAEYDVQWVQRDAKCFTQSEDPDVSNTVYAGDLWLQGGIG